MMILLVFLVTTMSCCYGQIPSFANSNQMPGGFQLMPSFQNFFNNFPQRPNNLAGAVGPQSGMLRQPSMAGAFQMPSYGSSLLNQYRQPPFSSFGNLNLNDNNGSTFQFLRQSPTAFLSPIGGNMKQPGQQFYPAFVGSAGAIPTVPPPPSVNMPSIGQFMPTMFGQPSQPFVQPGAVVTTPIAAKTVQPVVLNSGLNLSVPASPAVSPATSAPSFMPQINSFDWFPTNKNGFDSAIPQPSDQMAFMPQMMPQALNSTNGVQQQIPNLMNNFIQPGANNGNSTQKNNGMPEMPQPMDGDWDPNFQSNLLNDGFLNGAGSRR